MTRARGNLLQNALAAHLAGHGWPSAESAGAGRQGTDVLGTPGVAWECKTAVNFKTDFKPTMWVEQSKRHAARGGELPVTVYFPPGVGAMSVDHTLAIVPLHVLMHLLREAGYCPAPELATNQA